MKRSEHIEQTGLAMERAAVCEAKAISRQGVDKTNLLLLAVSEKLTALWWQLKLIEERQ